jgi:hypothetical protein
VSFGNSNSDLRKEDFRKIVSFASCSIDVLSRYLDGCSIDDASTAALFFFFIILEYLSVAAG